MLMAQVRPRIQRVEAALAPRVANAETHMKPHVNKAVMALGVVYPMATAPQVYNVWVLRHTAGFSGLTSGVGLAMAIMWTLYGVLHHNRTIWVINVLWIGLHAAMVVGLLRYGV
jgi:hypothetical protein